MVSKLYLKLDEYSRKHSINVAIISRQLAKQLGYIGKKLDALTIAALLHDIGKMSTPPEILLSKEKLIGITWGIMQEHAKNSGLILELFEETSKFSEVGRNHHEKLDGSGYPQGLKGDQISMNVRIVTVVDMFEAIISKRPYHPPSLINIARQILDEEAINNKLDSTVVNALFAFLDNKKLDDHNIQEFLEKEYKTIMKTLDRFFNKLY